MANPSPPSSEDEHLVQQFRLGDPEAFEKIVRRYQQDLMHFLVRFCHDPATAEDVFQDTFLQVHQSLETFDATRRFKPWLFTIAANKARDHLRRRSRRNAMPLDAPVSRQDREQTFIDFLAAPDDDPTIELSRQETQERVSRALEEMPEHLREILLLAYFQKLAYGDIAEMLQVPLGTVKSRLHAAVARFGKLWKKSNPETEPA